MKRIVYGYTSIIWIGFYGSRLFMHNDELDFIGQIIVQIGYIFFMASDTVLSISLWIKTNRIIRFIVMFTYYIAQFCISVGYYIALNGYSSIVPF